MNKSKSVPKVYFFLIKSPAGSKTTKKAPTEWRERISPESYEQLRDTFLIFDEDGSGTIDPQ